MSNYNFYLGLDIAKRSDYSAIVIVEKPFWSVRHDKWLYLTELSREEANSEHREECVAQYYSSPEWPTDWKLRVLSAQRWAKKTAYPQVAEDVGRIFTGMDSALVQIALLVDITGQGEFMTDELRKAGIPAIGLNWGGTAQKPSWDETDTIGKANVPKGHLVIRTRMLFDQEQIELSPFPEQDDLIEELYSYQMKTNAVTGHESWEAASNTHDDLVSALMMACWFAHQDKGVPDTVVGKTISDIGYAVIEAHNRGSKPYAGYGMGEGGGGQLHHKFAAPWLIA